MIDCKIDMRRGAKKTPAVGPVAGIFAGGTAGAPGMPWLPNACCICCIIWKWSGLRIWFSISGLLISCLQKKCSLSDSSSLSPSSETSIFLRNEDTAAWSVLDLGLALESTQQNAHWSSAAQTSKPCAQSRSKLCKKKKILQFKRRSCLLRGWTPPFVWEHHICFSSNFSCRSQILMWANLMFGSSNIACAWGSMVDTACLIIFWPASELINCDIWFLNTGSLRDCRTSGFGICGMAPVPPEGIPKGLGLPAKGCAPRPNGFWPENIFPVFCPPRPLRPAILAATGSASVVCLPPVHHVITCQYGWRMKRCDIADSAALVISHKESLFRVPFVCFLSRLLCLRISMDGVFC